MQDTKKSINTDEEILRVARERFKLAEEAEYQNRIKAKEDVEFRAGIQWPESILRERDRDNRPSLTINKIPQFIRQITNDQRQNRPSIKVSPVDDKADIETAKILQGIIRHIEYNSSADIATDNAFEGAATSGLGYFRITHDYVDPTSFDQELLIKQIVDANNVYRDPYSKEPDGSDMSWCFVFEDIAKDDFKNKYPNSDLSKSDDWSMLESNSDGWIAESSVRVAEYFYTEYKDVMIYQLSDGSVFQESELPEILPEGVEVRNSRLTKIPKINWIKINGSEVLERTEWMGKWIPIIPVYGDRLIVDGKLILEGVIRHAKDSQRMYNYWASTETETIALAPRAPYLVADGQIEGYEEIWATANTKNHAFLPYNPVSIEGAVVGAPQRNQYEPPVSAVSNARMLASEDIKATTGIYDPSLGASGREVSGIAIQRRNQQSQTSNFHFIDNLTRSLKHAGRILVDLIPKVYDTERAVRILGEDDEQEIVTINGVFNYKGEQKVFNLGHGKYDVAVETGPSYATKRQEAAASMLELSKAAPQLMATAGDLIVKNMDWNGASEIAERLKKTIDPKLIEDTTKKQGPLPPEIQNQLGQMDQMIQQLTEQLNIATEKEKAKLPELQTKERIELEKIQSNERIEAAKLELEYLKIQQAQAPNLATEAVIKELAHLNAMQEIQNKNLKFNESVPVENAIQNEQQQNPTGGQSPGKFTGV